MSGCYFNKQVILQYSQQVLYQWNANPTIFKLQVATLVVSKFWATIQPVYELRTVS